MILTNVITRLRYLLASTPYSLEKPIVLQFPVINICNSRCQMCRIWENRKSDEISPDELRQGLRNPLYSEVVSVGLNGGEPTLRNDLAALTAVLFEELPKLRNISLITNAYEYQNVTAKVGHIGEVVKNNGGNFDVMVSLDGYGELHDLVRGKPGNFERSQRVLDFIQTSDLVHNVRIGCTIIKYNVYGLHDLLEFCQSRDLYIKFRLGIPHKRLYMDSPLGSCSLTMEDKYHVAEFLEGLIAHYETQESQKFFYRSLIDQLLHNAPRKAGCDWRHRGATITAKGELLYCAVQSKALGLIQENNSEVIFFGNESHLRDIVANKCATCKHDYVGLPPRSVQAKQMIKHLLQRTHMVDLVTRLRTSPIVMKRNGRRRFEARLQHLLRLTTASALSQPPPKKGRPRVLICGWYGTETLGDKAILGGVLQAISAALGPVDFTIVSLFPYVTRMTQRQLPELDGVRLVSPDEGAGRVQNMDLVVFGGGPLMGIDELADMEVFFATARKNGIPTLVAGCGIGPLGEAWHNQSLKRLLTYADLRIYRDLKALNYARELDIDTSNDFVAEDPAFTWLLANRPVVASRAQSDRKVLLLGLRDFPHAQYARHLSRQGCWDAKQRYEREVVKALEQLARRHPLLIIRPLPMCTNHFGGDDRWFYRRLFRGNGLLQSRLDQSLLGAELNPPVYCEAFLAADVALTMRFHSIVFALGLEVPTVAIDYTLGKGKVHALAEQFGVPYQSLAEVECDFIVNAVDQFLQKPEPQALGFEPVFSSILAQKLPAMLSRSIQ